MSARDQGRSDLEAALAALDRVAGYVAGGRGAFDSSEDRQLALVFLWANIGSLLKQYCRNLGIGTKTEPYAGPIRMRDRLVYGSVLGIRPDIVWETCVTDAPDLAIMLREIRDALG